MARNFNYYQAPGVAADFSPIERGAEFQAQMIAEAARALGSGIVRRSDRNAALREAAQARLFQASQSQLDRDASANNAAQNRLMDASQGQLQRDAMATQGKLNRGAQLYEKVLGEQGWTQRNREDNQTRLRIEQQKQALMQEVEQRKALALRGVREALKDDSPFNPYEDVELRPVDVHPELRGLSLQELEQKFTTPGRTPEEAKLLAKSLWTPVKNRVINPERTVSLRTRLASEDAIGPEAGDYALESTLKGHKTLDEFYDDLYQSTEKTISPYRKAATGTQSGSSGNTKADLPAMGTFELTGDPKQDRARLEMGADSLVARELNDKDSPLGQRVQKALVDEADPAPLVEAAKREKLISLMQATGFPIPDDLAKPPLDPKKVLERARALLKPPEKK